MRLKFKNHGRAMQYFVQRWSIQLTLKLNLTLSFDNASVRVLPKFIDKKEMVKMNDMVGAFRDFPGYDLAIIGDMTDSEKVDMMVEWFNLQFEDPQSETPYNSDVGEYVYLWGGPFDANDQIQEEFSEAIEFDLMVQAVEQVQSGGTIEWAPQTGGDFYNHPEDDRVSTGEIVDGDDEWPPIIADVAPMPAEPDARAEVLRRLDALETLIQPVLQRMELEAQPAAMMGHNNPPEELDIIDAIPREEWLNVKDAVDQIREQTTSESPNIEVIKRKSNVLSRAVTLITRWMAQRITTALDNAGGVAIGAAAVAGPEKTLEVLNAASNAVTTWIGSLSAIF